MDENLQAKYDALEAEKATLNPDNSDDKFRLTLIQQEQDRIMAQAAEQERLQQQAEAVATVTLPHDYDTIWGVTGANDEIMNLIRETYEMAFSSSNDELAQLQENYQGKLAAAEAEKATLTAQAADLQASLDATTAQAQQAEADKLAAQEAQQDAESKRDNAVRMMEEAQADRDKAVAQVDSLKRQIDELEAMNRTYKTRAAAGSFGGGLGGLKLTSTIKAPDEDDLKAQRERDRIEQINKGLARIGSAPLPLPPAPAASSDEPEEAPAAAEAAHDDRFPVAADAVDAGELAEGDVDGPVAGQDAAGLTLEQKVATLWEDYQARTTPATAAESVA